MPSRTILIGVGTLFAAINFSTAAFAIDMACFSGVWVMNKELSPTSTVGPMRLIAPFGDNGWVSQSGGEGSMRFATAETRLVAFNGRVYTILGTDPREVYETENGDYGIDTTVEGSVGEGTNTIRFSEDCMRMDASTTLDTRIYDKVLPPGASAMAPSGFYYGTWIMNQQASTLTRPGTRDASSTDDEFVLITPWGNDGWAYSVVSGGYQPADLIERGMTAPILQRRHRRLQEAYLATMQPVPPDYNWRVQRETYYATWNGTPAYTIGSYPRQVELRKIDDHHFEKEFVRIHQPWLAVLGSVQSNIVFSDDGKRMTVTSRGVGASAERFENDIRVYDKADPAEWPSKESSFPPQ